ncbi:hypothetical protein BS47DRAFT_1389177 [Hydnum rufescens UP504]|uniref:LIM zinc-binding domain-containing protein n=1 Tax=Hydnum rufescens UP504 TaxID=1448309 RepID=A0A9P6B668_9AGAM|nr:hypothetical protein BS47DRAFT_1389177 [Hydnum rufescens UP504]
MIRSYVQESIRKEMKPTEPSEIGTTVDQSPPSTALSSTESSIPRPSSSALAKSTARFPRPKNSTLSHPINFEGQSRMLNRVSAHITTVTSRPTSPLKNQVLSDKDPSDGTIVKSHITGSLVKVYGSVLGRPGSLPSMQCHTCSQVFLPDATIYPSPTLPDTYLCRECFESDEGASRGTCEACHKPVFGLLKVEGGPPVENAGRIWHASCFRCNGCEKDIAASPMVDILGRPCCESCFDQCLEKGSPSPAPKRSRVKSIDKDNYVGTVKRGGKESMGSREGSPVMDELSKRLGLVPSPNSSPPSPSSSVSPRTGGRVAGEISPTIERLARKLNGLGISNASNTSPLLSRRDSQHPTNLPSLSTTPFGAPESTPEGRVSISSSTSCSTSPRSFDSTSSLSMSTTSTAISSPADSPPSTRNKELEGLEKDETPASSTVSYASTNTVATQSPRTSDMVDRRETPAWTSPSTFLDPQGMYRMGDYLERENPPPKGNSQGNKLPHLRNTADSGSPVSSSGQRTPIKNSTPTRARPRESFNNDSTPTSSSKTTTPTAQSAVGPHSRRLSSSFKSPTGTKQSPLHVFTTPEALVNAKCDACGRPLLAQDMRGRIVTVPKGPTLSTNQSSKDESHDNSKRAETPVERYHHTCFRCATCGDAFGELDGKANFIREEGRVVHVSCASPLRVVRTNIPVPSKKVMDPTTFNRSSTVPDTISRIPASKPRTMTSSRATTPPAPVSPTSSGRFICGGCHNTVFQMEKGVVTGPQGSKWHMGCLVCGGKDWKARKEAQRRKNEGNEIGCGKKLDSQARTDRYGQVWCRDCMTLLSPSRDPSPVGRGILQPMNTGNGTTYGRLNFAFPQTSRKNSDASGRIDHLISHFTGSGETISSSSSVFDSVSPSLVRTHFTGRSASPSDKEPLHWEYFLHHRGNYSSDNGSGLPVTHRPMSMLGLFRSTSPVKNHATGGGAMSVLSPQVTGGGLPVTRPRPKSVMSIRGGISHRGIELVRQMTGTES